jgi:diamine N-acetyltransferase
MSIVLRPTLVSDLDFVIASEQADENSPFIVVWTREQHELSLSSADMAQLIIQHKAKDKPVGYVILTGLAQPHQSIEFRRIVVTDKGNGYGRESLRLIKKMAFDELGAHRLWLDVKEHNTRARHLYESEGFVVEGVLRECIKVGDTFESLVVLSILQSEYQKTKGHDTYEKSI